MKAVQKITRLKLDVENNNDYILLGLVSAEPDYRLSLSLNKKLKISLRNIEPVKITGEKGTDLVFSRFANNNDQDDLFFCLISNRCGKNFLLNKLKNIDYLLEVQYFEKGAESGVLASQIKEIESVTAVFTIDTDIIKDKNLHYLI